MLKIVSKLANRQLWRCAVPRLGQTNIFAKSLYSTAGENQLSKVLIDEIKAEKESMQIIDVPKKFAIKKVKGGEITLERKDKDGMNIEVHVSLAGSVGVDDSETTDEDKELESLPDFTITMIKPNGRKVTFNCSLNVEAEDLKGDVVTPTYSVSSIEVDNIPEYHTNSELMDMKVFENLSELLLERGLDLTFQNELKAFCTAEEHKLYCKLLEGLKDFCQ